MPNIYAGPDGTAIADVFNTKAAIGEDADATIFDSDGSAIIVHAKPDGYGESPGAGDRIACGVITRN
jgi:Cu-Zn family superoxide dismutase